MLNNASFLARIVKAKREEVNERISHDPSLKNIKKRARDIPVSYCLYEALQGSNFLSVIAEIKRASPSRGIMSPDLNPEFQSRLYQKYGAAAISVITERNFFNGSLDDLKRTRKTCSMPILRKDFIIHPYQIYETRAYGIDAVLLIAAILSEENLVEFSGIIYDLGMEPLVEIHNQEEAAAAIKCEARLIGINNRDLKTFNLDIETTKRLIPLIPKDRIIVSESGIRGPEEAKKVAGWGARAVLVGEALVTNHNPKDLLKNLTKIRCVQE